MAKREEAVNMTDQFAEFKELKNIDKTTLISVLEESFRSVLAKMFGNDDNFDVIVNPDKGDCEIYQNLEVVPDGEEVNPNKQITLSEAQADDDPDCEVGEEHTRKIDFAKFGRRAILNLRQTLASKILDLQKDAIYNKFKAIEALENGEVVIMSGGTGNPYFTTDTGSSLRGIEIEADVMLKGTRVDGVYTADPEKDPTATKYHDITFDEIYNKNLRVMDLTATTMCKENGLPIYVFNMDIPGNLKKVMEGEDIGTLVHN